MKRAKIWLAIWTVLLPAIIAGAAQPTSRPAETPLIKAKVVKVVGRVQHSPINETKWVQTQQGDVLDEGMRVRTGFKSAVQLQLHTAALVQVQSATQIALVELARQGESEKTRIGLKYGKVRGGILREEVSSDFQIACPTAVLTREGTWGFEMSYDPATGNYLVGLDTDGLVRVLNTLTGKRVGIVPGQFVTQAMQEWFKTAEFERMVDLIDQYGVTHVEKIFYALNSGGRTAVDPTGTVFAADFTRSMQKVLNVFAVRCQEAIKENNRNSRLNTFVDQLQSKNSGNQNRKVR
jgi:hypothetical protein